MKIDKLMLHCSELIINRTELTQNLQNNKMTINIQRDRKLTEHKNVGKWMNSSYFSKIKT